MRVAFVSDVHGRADALARAGQDADLLVCLGDLLLFLDYADDRVGIFADLFGPAAVRRLVGLRAERRFDDARAFSAGLWADLAPDPGERRRLIDGAAARQYAQLMAALPTPALLTYGNVDLPEQLRACLPAGARLLDGEVAEVGGVRFGFVGGGLRTPMRTPFEIDDEVYAAKVAAVGAVDVLASHIPPHLPDLVYDVVGRRYERGSVALLGAIAATAPALSVFGHVHQPLRDRVRLGATECRNVGHFRGRRTPLVLDL